LSSEHASPSGVNSLQKRKESKKKKGRLNFCGGLAGRRRGLSPRNVDEAGGEGRHNSTFRHFLSLGKCLFKGKRERRRGEGEGGEEEEESELEKRKRQRDRGFAGRASPRPFPSVSASPSFP
jgi:hypothetical protein